MTDVPPPGRGIRFGRKPKLTDYQRGPQAPRGRRELPQDQGPAPGLAGVAWALPAAEGRAGAPYWHRTFTPGWEQRFPASIANGPGDLSERWEVHMPEDAVLERLLLALERILLAIAVALIMAMAFVVPLMESG